MSRAGPTRRSREESRAETRRRLLDAATTCFAREGIGATTVEQIAAEAGFTRGAFYSNFETKDALVVELLDERVNRTITEVGELLDANPTPEAFFAALTERDAALESQREERDAVLLKTELWLYAVRNRQIRPKLAARLAALRKATAHVVQVQFDTAQVPLPGDAETMAAVVHALDDGIALHRLVDPDAYPAALIFETLLAMQQGAVALAHEEERTS
jgi:AcrR family transcriptional regulator